MKWHFSPQLKDQVETEVTQRDQFNNDDVDLSETIVREAVQNSLDAAVDDSECVTVTFRWQSQDDGLSPAFFSSLCMHLTGSRITHVTGAIANVGGQTIGVEDSAVATLEFDNGTLGTLTPAYFLDKGYHSQIKIWGSQGWLQLQPGQTPALKWNTTKEPFGDSVQHFTEGT